MTVYTVLTPHGSFTATWSDDEDVPVSYAGDEKAIAYFRAVLDLPEMTGQGGARLQFEHLEPADLSGFCQSEKHAINVLPDADSALAAIIDETDEDDQMGVLDAASPLERVRLAKQIADLTAAIGATTNPAEKVRLNAQLAALVRELAPRTPQSKTLAELDTLDLQSPDAYANNRELAAIAKKVAAEKWVPGTMGRGEFKREVLAGKHPELVRQAIEATLAEKQKAQDAEKKGAEALANVDLPSGYSVAQEGNSILVKGKFDDDLHSRIKRAGGRWDGVSGTNRRLWIVPAAKATSLATVLSNWAKANAERLAKAAEEAEAAARALEEARATAPEVPLGEQGPFMIREAGNRYIVSFRYDPDLVKAIKQAGSARFNPSDKSWSVDKADAARLLAIIERGKAAAEKAAAEAAAKREAEALAKQAKAAAEAEQGIVHVSYWADRGGYGLPSVGETVKRRDDYFVVTAVSKGRYMGEDAMSFGGTDDRPYQHRVTLRRATEAERAAYVEREEREAQEWQRKQDAQQAIRAVIETIQSSGTRPERAEPEGETVWDTFTPYGTGDRLIIGTDRIWYVRNNGMDGDDWSQNNTTTGGAGAIAWWVPKTPELEQKIREAASDAALDSVMTDLLDELDGLNERFHWVRSH